MTAVLFLKLIDPSRARHICSPLPQKTLFLRAALFSPPDQCCGNTDSVPSTAKSVAAGLRPRYALVVYRYAPRSHLLLQHRTGPNDALSTDKSQGKSSIKMKFLHMDRGQQSYIAGPSYEIAIKLHSSPPTVGGGSRLPVIGVVLLILIQSLLGGVWKISMPRAAQDDGREIGGG